MLPTIKIESLTKTPIETSGDIRHQLRIPPGEQAEISCTAKGGYPTSTIDWVSDDFKLLKPDTETDAEAKAIKFPAFKSGTVSCVAKNDAGTVRETVNVLVTGIYCILIM